MYQSVGCDKPWGRFLASINHTYDPSTQESKQEFKGVKAT